MQTQFDAHQQHAAPRRWRSIFISDLHLGTRGCKSEMLLDFLRCNESDCLYLVGDIIDGWRLKRARYWPQEHNDVVQKVLRKVRKGTRTIYVPGNHDEFLRDYLEMHVGGIEILPETVHTTADGRRLLIIHGDQFDGVMLHAKWLAHLGDTAYTLALNANNILSYVRRKLGLPYWSLSCYLKHRVKKAVNFISDFESALSAEALRRGVDGVVCGHIHHAEMREINGVLYCNDGDWVESCTALVEDFDGKLYLIRWLDQSTNEVKGETHAHSDR
jgi:UDP-2,3-diacylglucosamine pyrophosphatase LpxH